MTESFLRCWLNCACASGSVTITAVSAMFDIWIQSGAGDRNRNPTVLTCPVQPPED